MKEDGILRALPEDLRAQLLRRYQYASTPQMQAAGRNEPGVWRQFEPDPRELEDDASESDDPIGDAVHSPLPFLVHRYRDRVLWKISPLCAVYCRFCFRKEQIGRKGAHPERRDIEAAAQYLAAHEEISEVIFSGGDPLALSPGRLQTFIAPLREIAHIRRLRIHTRIPVVAPQQITDELCALFADSGKTTVFVIHINHPGELSAAADRALADLRRQALLLSQSVLLKGINDDVDTLSALFSELLARHIHPYYLHHPDRARGTAHFRLTLAEGRALYQRLRAQLSGIALPEYMVEIPGGGGKIAVMQLDQEMISALQRAGVE